MTAWDVLLKCGICELPVDLRKVCKGLGIGLFSYSQGYSIIQNLDLFIIPLEPMVFCSKQMAYQLPFITNNNR